MPKAIPGIRIHLLLDFLGLSVEAEDQKVCRHCVVHAVASFHDLKCICSPKFTLFPPELVLLRRLAS